MERLALLMAIGMVLIGLGNLMEVPILVGVKEDQPMFDNFKPNDLANQEGRLQVVEGPFGGLADGEGGQVIKSRSVGPSRPHNGGIIYDPRIGRSQSSKDLYRLLRTMKRSGSSVLPLSAFLLHRSNNFNNPFRVDWEVNHFEPVESYY